MGGSSRHSRKRKGDDEDTSEEVSRRSKRTSKSRSRSPDRKSKRREKDSSPSRDEPSESMSIEETNKLRAKLGLAPLETDDGPTSREAEDGSTIFKEDGMEFRHKKAENWSDKKRDQDIKEKLEEARKKRQVYEKVLRAKNLADSDSDDDAAGWVDKMRKQDEEKKRAAEREKMLNDMDEEFGVDSIIAGEKAKQDKAKGKAVNKQKRSKTASDQAGLLVGHSKEAFLGMQDQILVLDDKDVLDEGDETLVNPNLLDNERHAKNVELRKRKDNQRGFDEDLDQFGNPKNFGVLAKYDEELEGVQKEKFRLDDGGTFDLQKEEREAKMRQQLEMAGKTLVSLEMPKYKLASEFYTQEEMISFRKPKKVKKEKLRKRGKLLKADDLVPDEPAGGAAQNAGSRDRGSRRRRNSEDAEQIENAAMDTTDGDVKKEPKESSDAPDESTTGLWKKATTGAVDIDRLKKLANYQSDEEESDDEEMGGGGLGGILIDDDAHDELSSILDKARKLKQREVKSEADDQAHRVQSMISSHGGNDVKMEVDEESGEREGGASSPLKDGVIYIDSTMEYCRNIGENLTYGLAGNRTDAIDVDHLKQEEEQAEAVALARVKEAQAERERQKKKKKETKDEAKKGGWLDAGPSAELDSDDERELAEARERARERDGDRSEESSDSDEEADGQSSGKKKNQYENVLGKEADVTKGVGAMLKLAAEKGYLSDPNAMRNTGQNLDHLKNQSKQQIEVGKYDIEDKYAKKLDRLGTTGRGPIVAFQEKSDYNPEVNISYVDNKGRPMEQKEAYRELSYKFHGRNPGKKQTEKRINQRDKREMMKQMNSSDTPLGTLTKQLKKQEQLQTPYLVLSGSGRSDHTSIKKE